MSKIIVYGACDDGGDSFLYSSEPEKMIHDGKLLWLSPYPILKLPGKNLFSSDKPEKFSLLKMVE